MPVLVTSLYAGLLALVCIVLGSMVGQLRGKKKISLGDSGDPEMIVANRRHVNFVEYVPLALLLMALVELNGAPKPWVHTLGAVLLAARILHPFGIDAGNMMMWQRFVGALATSIVIVAAALTLLWQYFR